MPHRLLRALFIWPDTFVDVSVRPAEMLPCAPAGSLRLRVDELDSGRGHRGVNARERIDSEPDHRCTPEEVVVLVPRTVDVHFGAVSQPEPCRTRPLQNDFELEHIPVEAVIAAARGVRTPSQPKERTATAPPVRIVHPSQSST
jgi:hypothetical protein